MSQDRDGLCIECVNRDFTMAVQMCPECRVNECNSVFNRCSDCAIFNNMCSYCDKPLQGSPVFYE